MTKRFVSFLVLSAASAFGQASSSPQASFQFGSLGLQPGVSYSYSQSTGTESSPGHPADSAIQTTTATLGGIWGDNWTFSYAADWMRYSSSDFSNAFNQSANLTGKIYVGEWALRLSQGVSLATTPLLETGAETRQDMYSTGIAASRRLTDTLQYETEFSQQIESASVAYSHGRDWGERNAMLYVFNQEVSAGPEVQVDYMELVGSMQLIQISPQVRLNWTLNNQTSVVVHGGLTAQEFISGGFGNSDNPEGGVAINFVGTHQTAVTLSGEETASFSFLTDQQSRTGSVSLGVQQPLLSHYFIGGTVDADRVRYSATPGVGVPFPGERSDRVFGGSLNAGVQGLFKHGTISIFYRAQSESSSAAGLSQSPRSWGIQAGYSY